MAPKTRRQTAAEAEHKAQISELLSQFQELITTYFVGRYYNIPERQLHWPSSTFHTFGNLDEIYRVGCGRFIVDTLQKIAAKCGEQHLWTAHGTATERLDAAREYHGTLDTSAFDNASLPVKYRTTVLSRNNLFDPDCSVSRISSGLLAVVMLSPLYTAVFWDLAPPRSSRRRFLNKKDLELYNGLWIYTYGKSLHQSAVEWLEVNVRDYKRGNEKGFFAKVSEEVDLSMTISSSSVDEVEDEDELHDDESL